MAGYAKLFGSILHSTIWLEPLPTKVVWITMLALSDRDGIVEASVPGLAKAAGVPLEDCSVALASFLSPDPHSRTKDYEGRRIEAIDGGWKLLNYEKYSERQSGDDLREKAAARQARYRQRHPEKVTLPVTVTSPVTSRNAQSRLVTASNILDQAQIKLRSEHTEGVAVWPAAEWHKRFSFAWCDKYQQPAMGGGESAAKATGQLHDELAALSGEARLSAQARFTAMFAEYLGDESPAVVKARHPWSWFVTRFAGLRVPSQATSPGDIERRKREQATRASEEAKRIIAELEGKAV